MRPIEEMPSAAVDRRTFLKWMPRQVFNGMKELMTDISSASSTISHEVGAGSGRRLATIDLTRCLAWEASLPALPDGSLPAPSAAGQAGAQVGECQLCYLRCPLRDEAIVLDGGKPTIVAQACDGCGVCVEACRAVNDLGAIHIRNI